MANSSTTYSIEREAKNLAVITFSWLSDDASGVITAKATDEEWHGFLVRAVTNPGSAAPTDNYDVILNDADSCDVLGGEGADRDTTTSEQIIPKLGNSYGPARVDSTLTFSGSAAGNAKTGTFVAYIELD